MGVRESLTRPQVPNPTCPPVPPVPPLCHPCATCATPVPHLCHLCHLWHLWILDLAPPPPTPPRSPALPPAPRWIVILNYSSSCTAQALHSRDSVLKLLLQRRLHAQTLVVGLAARPPHTTPTLGAALFRPLVLIAAIVRMGLPFTPLTLQQALLLPPPGSSGAGSAPPDLFLPAALFRGGSSSGSSGSSSRGDGPLNPEDWPELGGSNSGGVLQSQKD